MARSSNSRNEFSEQFFVEGYLAIMKTIDILKELYETKEISDENHGILAAAIEKGQRYELNI
jgi:hypothetical protein